MSRQEMLLHTLVELADTLVEDFDVVDLLTNLTDRCVDAFDIRAAGIMLAAPMGADLRVIASSSDTMRDLELLELQAGEGPCLDAYRSGETVLASDLHRETHRWPRFVPAALAAGFTSVNAIPMRHRGVTIGGLNLFGADSGSMTDPELAAARAFADVATIAILQHRATVDAKVLNDQLTLALNTRITLEQAKGMLAERAGIDIDTAFTRLRQHARDHNMRLVDVAQAVLDGTMFVH